MEQIRQKPLSKRQKDFLAIFKSNLCLVTQSCNQSNVSRAMYYRWLEQELFNQAVEETKETTKDFGEHALYKLIKEGNPSAVIFFNKTKNKNRGYIEKTELEHSGSGRIEIVTNIPKEVQELLDESRVRPNT
tara:strand:+ start:828 stop:1223 length:396 start_codon:yes stop_codon:yes gene_type:complete